MFLFVNRFNEKNKKLLKSFNFRIKIGQKFYYLNISDRYDSHINLKDTLEMSGKSNNQPTTLPQFLTNAAQFPASVVDFYANWCGPCRAIAPHVHTKTRDEKVNLIKVNVDVNQQTAAKYNVQAMPTFLVVDSVGNVLFEKSGASKEIVNKAFEIAKAKY